MEDMGRQLMEEVSGTGEENSGNWATQMEECDSEDIGQESQGEKMDQACEN